MLRTNRITMSIIATVSLILISSPVWSKSFECTYDGAADVEGSSVIDIDTDSSMYAYRTISSDPESLHTEGSLVSEVTFVEGDGDLAAILIIKGMMQGGQIVQEFNALTTFYLGTDGKFTEVKTGSVEKGTCKAISAEK